MLGEDASSLATSVLQVLPLKPVSVEVNVRRSVERIASTPLPHCCLQRSSFSAESQSTSPVLRWSTKAETKLVATVWLTLAISLPVWKSRMRA